KPRTPRKKFFIYLPIFLAVVFLMAGVWFIYSIFTTLPNPERISERSIAQSTKIYDRTGTVVLYEIHGEEKRTVVSLNDIPETVKQAALTAEDINFYQHSGIDFKGILRAAFVNISHGDISQGGSTITQQLIKNSILTNERTFTRKIKEVILSLLIEKRYTKDEILGLYLNQIPYGSNAYGVGAAAETFFGKQVGQLTVSEAALIASLPKAPTYYSPYGSHKDELLKRRDWVLDRMATSGFISTDQAKSAKKEKITFSLPKQGIRAPHFVMYVREYLNEKYGEQFVESGGLRVITTLDWNLQQMAEKTILEGTERNAKLVGAKNASLVSIDPKTGDILAMVGSRDYFDLANDGNVNVAIRPRQPGSSFKPFVYAAAFKKGYTPETALFDAPTEFNVNCNADGTPGPNIKDPKDCYHPKNYDDTFRGPVDLRHSLAQSLNVPSVKLLYLVGIDDAIRTASEMGISTLTDPRRYGLSLVLGGAEVNLLEMTSAYGIFAQDGILHPKTSILRIENAGGIILEEKQDSAVPVLDTEIARDINDVLSDNDARIPIFSPNSSLYFPDRRVAAKTGTTQDYRDAWTIGYTPSLVTGIWVGNNDNSAMNKNAASVMVAAPIWHDFMQAALSTMPPEDFTPPDQHQAEKPILRGVYRNGGVIKIDKKSRKLATALTPPELIEEVGYGEIISILGILRKDDPLGDPPTNTYGDPQYENWQAAINTWVSQHQLPIAMNPTGFDDTHTQEKQPHVTLISPAQDTISAQDLNEITISVDSFFPLQEIQIFINDGMLDSQTAPITQGHISFPLSSTPKAGSFKIRVVAYDGEKNKVVMEKVITVTDPDSQ
ncbi:MAG: PBP1A family penicillin-binding protein, partial [bacterium]|nr:PBP1A family penicillin-binding protein [bacterium]